MCISGGSRRAATQISVLAAAVPSSGGLGSAPAHSDAQAAVASACDGSGGAHGDLSDEASSTGGGSRRAATQISALAAAVPSSGGRSGVPTYSGGGAQAAVVTACDGSGSANGDLADEASCTSGGSRRAATPISALAAVFPGSEGCNGALVAHSGAPAAVSTACDGSGNADGAQADDTVRISGGSRRAATQSSILAVAVPRIGSSDNSATPCDAKICAGNTNGEAQVPGATTRGSDDSTVARSGDRALVLTTTVGSNSARAHSGGQVIALTGRASAKPRALPTSRDSGSGGCRRGGRSRIRPGNRAWGGVGQMVAFLLAICLHESTLTTHESSCGNLWPVWTAMRRHSSVRNGYDPKAEEEEEQLVFTTHKLALRFSLAIGIVSSPEILDEKMLEVARGPTAQTRRLTGPTTRGQGGQGCRGVSTFMSMLSSLQLAVVSE